MNELEFRQEIKKIMGEPLIKIELDDANWDEAIIETKRWFLAKKGIVGAKGMTVSGRQSVRFSDIDSTYGVNTILDVYFGQDPALTGMYYDCVFGVFTNGFPILTSSIFRGYTLMSMSTYTQAIMAIEQRRRVYGSEWDFEEYPGPDFDGNDYVLFDGPQNTSTNVLVTYKPRLTPEQMQFSWLKPRDIQLASEYGLASVKEILGRVRGKYSSYDTPAGNVSLDADKLLEEAKEVKERLEREISDSQGAMGFITG